MNSEPNAKQTLVLWALLAAGGAAEQKDLPLKVERKDRDGLVKTGLLDVQKGRRGALRLEVTDKGWGWAGDHLDAPLPSGRNATRSGTPILQAWLARLKAYLQARGLALADLLAPDPAPDEIDDAAASVPPSYEGLRERIRRACFAATGGRSDDGVPLSRIRRELADVPRQALDDALRRMHGEPGTILMSLDNPRDADAERGHAVDYKGERMHVLWVTR